MMATTNKMTTKVQVTLRLIGEGTSFKPPSPAISFLLTCLCLFSTFAAIRGDETFLWGLWHHPPTLAPFSAGSPASPQLFTRIQSLDLRHLPLTNNISSMSFNESFPLTDDTLILSFANLSVLSPANLSALSFANPSISNCTTCNSSTETCVSACGPLRLGVLLEFVNLTAKQAQSCVGSLNDTKRCLSFSGFRPTTSTCARDLDVPQPPFPPCAHDLPKVTTLQEFFWHPCQSVFHPFPLSEDWWLWSVRPMLRDYSTISKLQNYTTAGAWSTVHPCREPLLNPIHSRVQTFAQHHVCNPLGACLDLRYFMLLNGTLYNTSNIASSNETNCTFSAAEGSYDSKNCSFQLHREVCVSPPFAFLASESADFNCSAGPCRLSECWNGFPVFSILVYRPSYVWLPVNTSD
ncbi:uncharacterized protein LOC143669187 [Tamandua tetradactyla]|uniref:uncharacterized protein LOC143669187 n=1 Tax=Tamandua tetradactyla TaxID=48850 RepID=UPI004054375A